jgi:hypothetical protein
METAPIANLFDQLLTAGGGVRAIESAKSSVNHALIGFAILCKVLANLVAGALGRAGRRRVRRRADRRPRGCPSVPTPHGAPCYASTKSPRT